LTLEQTSEINIVVNGANCSATIDNRMTLLMLLRDVFDLTAAKRGCDRGECGSCTVLLGSRPVNSCQVLACSIDGQEVLTLEGISEEDNLNYIQKSFIDNDGTQCGYCASGFIISAYSLLKNNHSPSDEDIKNAISGNLCRCNSYHTILDSIKSASQRRLNG
jgi:aerobic-type carbon monoxide dehydrogenase small subunit (CoxS/CutS family)